MNVYRDIAQDLGSNGFVTLRYDKRGVGQSQGDRLETGFRDLVADAKAAAEFLRLRHPGDPVILLGHSEGCTISVAVNAHFPVQGIVLLGGACESLSATLSRQQERTTEDLRTMRGLAGILVRALRLPERQARKSRAIVEKMLATDRPWIRVYGAKMNAKWIREHFQYDVRNDLGAVHCPVLAMSGSKDIQVVPEHVQEFAKYVSGPSEWHIIENMTHLLRCTESAPSMPTLMKLYRRQIREPIEPELMATLHGWLDRNFQRPESVGSATHTDRSNNANIHDE